MGIKDLFFKDENLNNFINTTTTIINTLKQNELTAPETDTDLTSDLIEKIYTESDHSDQTANEIKQLLSQITVPSDRLERYNTYKEIISSISLVKRILRVYISNILQKNPTTGKSLLFRRTESSVPDDEFSQCQDNLENIVKYFEIVKKLRYKILPILLGYGDVFVEVVNVDHEYEKLKNKNDISNSFSLLNEVKQLNIQLEKQQSESVIDKGLDLIATFLIEDIEPTLSHFDLLHESEEDPSAALNKIIIKIHHPKNIVKLEDKYGNIFGYIEVVEENTDSNYLDLSNLFSRVTNLSKSITTEKDQHRIIDKLIKKVLFKLIKSNLPNNAQLKTFSDFDKIAKRLDPAVFTFLKKLLIQSNALIKKDLNTIKKIRFISKSRLVPISLPSADYFPYGESLIDPLVLPSKLFLLAQLANVITKLSRAALIRKWIIDVGPTQMHSGLIQKLKRELYNTRVTIDSLSSFKAISNILSDYKDMFVLSKNGQRSIDVEVQALGDPSVKIADLEDSRREIMTISGIPSVYLGAEAPELREALVHANVSFATEISDIQEIVNEGINNILDIIYSDIYGKKSSPICTVTLIPPIVLILQLIEMTLSSVGNIAGVFNSMQIPFDPYMFLEKYVPYEDWKEFRKRAEQYQTELKLTQPPEQ